MTSAVNVPLRGVNGADVGVLSISALPQREAPQDRNGDAALPRGEPPIQLREAMTYHYKLDLPGVSAARLEPSELFDRDDGSGIAGRLNTRQYVGDIQLTAFDAAGGELGSGVVLVRAS